jgi:hypothetical protein
MNTLFTAKKKKVRAAAIRENERISKKALVVCLKALSSLRL